LVLGVALAAAALTVLAAPRLFGKEALAVDGYRVLALAAGAFAAGLAVRWGTRGEAARGPTAALQLVLLTAFVCFLVIFHGASSLAGMPVTDPRGERWWMAIPAAAPAVALLVAILSLALAVARRRQAGGKKLGITDPSRLEAGPGGG
jgi:hypothetical protein